MPPQAQNNALALHEILLSIADSLNEAQHQLRNMPPYDEYGRPNTIYQLPYLDFNLEVISQFTSAASMPESESKAITPSIRKFGTLAIPNSANLLKFEPFKNTETGNTVNNKIVSNISGRFVAVLPNEGLPQVFISCEAEQKVPLNTYEITARLLQATNEPVTGQRIEINFDQQTSFNINGMDLATDPLFKSMKDGYTNNLGEFKTIIEINNTDYNSGRTLVFVANSGTIFSSIAISKT